MKVRPNLNRAVSLFSMKIVHFLRVGGSHPRDSHLCLILACPSAESRELTTTCSLSLHNNVEKSHKVDVSSSIRRPAVRMQLNRITSSLYYSGLRLVINRYIRSIISMHTISGTSLNPPAVLHEASSLAWSDFHLDTLGKINNQL